MLGLPEAGARAVSQPSARPEGSADDGAPYHMDYPIAVTISGGALAFHDYCARRTGPTAQSVDEDHAKPSYSACYYRGAETRLRSLAWPAIFLTRATIPIPCATSSDSSSTAWKRRATRRREGLPIWPRMCSPAQSAESWPWRFETKSISRFCVRLFGSKWLLSPHCNDRVRGARAG